MSLDTMTPDIAETTSGPALPGSAASTYRSVADGELATPWTLPDYFASLNSVMRLPAKVRRRAEAAAMSTLGGARALATLSRIRLPKSLMTVSVLLAVAVLVVRPLMLDASGSGGKLLEAYGVWEAGKGKYLGRTFEIGDGTIAFGTSAKAADRTVHKIENFRTKVTRDSTLFTVTYLEEGKSAECAFWLFRGDTPVIKLVHPTDVVWTRRR
jgi:hypothetical protein